MKSLKKFKEYAHASVESKYKQDPTNGQSSYEHNATVFANDAYNNPDWETVAKNPAVVGSIPSNYPEPYTGGNFNATV